MAAARPDLLLLREPSHAEAEPGGGIVGRARLGRCTKRLVGRLARGEIAVVDHPEIDRLSAESLVARGVAGVVNVAVSASTRYPNLGPSVLVEAGVELVDAPGAPLFEHIEDGDELAVEGGRVSRGSRVLAQGRSVDRAAVARAHEAAHAAVDATFEEFVANTVAHLRAERGLLWEAIAMPELRTRLRGRPVLVVARGSGVRADLLSLRAFIRHERPVLVAVDGGADVVLAAGLSPDLVVGDMDSASDRALRAGSELVVHAYRDGSAPGAARLHELALPHRVLVAPGTSEDAALLLAAEGGARPIVSVGSSLSLVDFLDRGRSGMASTLLTRLRLGDLLVDARGVGMLGRS